MPPTLHRRVVALLLSWSVPASSAWAAAPPVVVPPAVGAAPALSVVPGLGEALHRAAYEARSGRDDDRRDGDDRKDRRDDKDDRDRDHRKDKDRDKSGSRNRRPILIRCECVEDEEDGTYTAHFGYESENADTVTIRAGADNEIDPGPSRRDQPTRFAPGRSRGWPDAPFRLRFDGQPVAWKLKGPDGSVRRATAALHLPRCGAIPPPCANPFWGPKRFEVKARDDDKKDKKKDEDDNRDHDWDDRDHRGHKHKRGERCERDDDDDHHKHPTVYEETIVVPPDTAPPYRLTVVNGGPGLKQRVLLAAVFVDGKLVAGPLHLNPFVRQVTREVKLAASSRLKVRLVGLPGSYLTLSLCGGSAPPPTDTTPPTIGVADPSAGALLASNTPALRVTYADPAGAGAPSGVDPATLVVTLDGQDRTAWFTRGPSEATAVVPADAVLAEGGHHLEARIRDAAGNEGTAVPVDFRVDSRPPQVEITDPQAGTVLSASTVDVSGTVLDASAIVRVQVAGIDAVLTGTTFTAAGVPLGDGPEVTLEAEAEDEAGNVGRGSVVVRVDRRAPTVTITRPAEGDAVQGPVIEVEGTVDDDGDVRVEVNGTPEDPPPSLRAPRSFLAHVPITDGTTELTATARDGAGNSGTTVVTVRTDTVAPTLVIDEPGPDLVTKETSVHVSGTATDASGIASVTVDGVPAVVDAGGAFEADVPLGPEGEQTIVVVATDGAQNPATASVTVTIDRTPPPVFTIASPAADALVGTQPVLVQGTVEDPQLAGVTVDGVAATVTGMAWQVSLAGLGDGVHTLEAVARDRAGNERSLSRDIRVDTAAPVVTIEQPDDQLLLKEAAVAVTGTVRDASLQSVRVNGLTAVVTGDPASPAGATFSIASVSLDEGVNPIQAVAEDELGRQGTASISVMRDSLPPQVGLSAPPLLVRGHADKAVATADDGTGSGVASVEFFVDGAPAATLGQPPFELPLEPPPTLASGGSFTVSVRATDLAGNVSPLASGDVRVVSEGMVVGQVLADTTSLPLAGASVRLVGAPGPPSVTDARGRYSLPVESASALVVAETVDHTSVERELPVALGTGAVPVDARLTALATAVSVDPIGGSLEAGLPGSRLAVSIPDGALPSTTDVHLTPLSAQGLPGLLPLGWSPLVAFDLRTQGGAPLAGPIAAQLTARDAAGKAATSFAGWPATPVVLAEYQPMLHAWVLVAAGLEPTAGELALTLPGAGAFALVVPDTGDPAPVVPAVGEALAGVPLAELPATAASRAVVEPAVLPPSGGTATGTLVVDSPLALPSGTVVQARVSETFSLASGETASSEERPMDIVLFRAPCTGIGETGGVSSACPDAGAAQVAARVPLTPSRSFGTSELLEGTVHLDILAGRESARGTTGGVAPVVVEAGGARLSVAGMALPTDTVVSLEQPEDLSSFLPSDPAWEPVGEVHVDLSGAVLQLAAELQVPYSGPDGTFVVGRVERVEGIPRVAVVALAALVGDTLVTQPSAILPGVTREGRHVFYRLSGPVGFVRGVTLDGATGTKALVTASGPPFIAASEPTGDYVLTTWPAAAVTVDARVPGMPLQAQGGPVEVVAGEATALDLLLSGTATTARVTPPNGSAGIAVNLRIEITPTVPLAPGSVAAATITLVRVSDGEAVPVRRVMGVGGRSLTVIPERKIADEYVPLEFATAYRLTVSGLEDTYGTGVAVPPTTFTTQVFTPPVLDVARLVFDLPDENGVVKVHAPAGSYPPGTTILIVNSGNGVVLSLTADNDGAVDGELPASADDRLLVTITDPQGNAKTFERSQYLIDPLTGETAVGAGGGVVTSPDAPGFELRVPKDATGQAVRLKIKALLESDFSELPALPDAEFGAALEVTAPDKPTFKKEVDLAFPLSALPPPPPDKTPEEAYYSVVRELKGPSGETWFQSIDEAKVECPGGQATCDDSEKKVVTASFPFIGMVTTFGGLTAGFSFLALETSRYLVMRTYAGALPGRSPWGAITGRVLQPVPIAGKPGQYEYKGVAGCSVRREGIGTGEVLAETQPAGEGLELGRLTFNAPWFTGGSVLLKANCGGRDYTGTAYVISGGAVEAIQDDGVKRLIGSGNYQTIGYVNITLPVAAEPPTAPRVEIRIFEEDGAGKRTDLKGVSVAGSPFQVGVRATGYVVRSVKIRGENQTLLVPDPLKNTKPKDPLAFDAILQDAFLPAGAGSYVIEATAMDPAQLTTVSGETVVQVLREPGGSTESVPGRPGVIAARTSPRDNARGVSVSAFPALDFTEPVKGVGPASVRLVPVGCAPPPAGSTGSGCTDTGASEDSPGAPVPLRIVGLKPGLEHESVDLTGTEVPPPYVVSLTLFPLVSLSFGTKYRLELTDAITDEDGELLVPYTSRFSTFLPEEVGKSNEADPPTVTGLVILGERGYVLETLHAGGVAGPQQSSVLRVYNVTDPVQPEEITNQRDVLAYPPRDIAGEEVPADDGSPSGVKLIAIATAPRTFYQVQGSDPYWTELKSTPANLFLYDVSDPDAKPRFAGAANITNNIVDGIPNRLFMQKDRIYAATYPKGIQVISIDNLRTGFETEPTGQELFDINKKLFAGGLNPGAIVLTIPVKDPTNGLTMPLNDLEAMDLQVWGVPRKVVAATGSRPQAGLVLADGISPYFETGDTQPRPLWLGPLAKDGSSLEWGGAIALTKINDIPHALVGGTGVIAGAGSQTLLAIVDLSPVAPAVPTGEPKPSPKVVAIVPLPRLNGVGDILLVGNTAVVSGATGTSIDGQAGGAALVDITDPENPQLSGYVMGIGSRLAHGANNILYSSNRSFIKTEGGEPGVRNTALGEVLFVRLAGQNPFGVDNDYRSEVELKASFGVIPADKEVKKAEVDLLRDGMKVESLTVVQVGSAWETTLQKGRVFNPDSEYLLQFVVNRGEPEEGKSAPKQLRPAWLEFVGTDEVTDESKLDLVKLFNPTPRVSLNPVADPGPGRRVKVRLNGEVRDSLGPIAYVAIDGRAVPVAQRSGPGPFVGTFTTEIDVGPQETLVLVHAMNSLGNLASDQGILTPVRDTNGLITGRTWTPRGELSPQDQDPRTHEFRVELKDKGQRGETVQVALDTGVETKRLTLRRVGTAFRSDPLYLVPESFLAAATLPQELKDRILRGRLGLMSRVLYAQNVEEEAAPVGALILDANTRTPIDSVQPSDAAAVKQALTLAVGMSGTAGPEVTVELASLREDLAPASPTSFVPFEQTITLVRQSADPKAGAFNLYLSSEPILPVYPAEAVDRAGFREHGVVASAFLRLRGPTGENIEAVGVPAEKAQWVVEDVRPVFVEGEERPRFFDVVVSARVTGVEGVVPALPLGMAFDLAADVVGETSSVKQVVPVGEVYEEAPFPARTNSEGKTYLRLRLAAAAASNLSPSQQLKGLTLRTLDVAGGTVLDLLRTLASGAPLPLLVRDALVRSGAAPLTTAFVRGVTEAGVPQGLEVIVGRIVRELYTPIVKAHPAFPAVSLAFRTGYQAYGTPLSPEEADELTVALIVGGCLGLPLGFGQAVYDDLNLFAQVRDLVQLLYYAVLASNELSRVKWILVAGAIEFVVNEDFRQDVRNRLEKLAPVLVEAAKVATNPEVIKFFGAVVLKAFYDGYDSALGPYTPWLGFTSDSRGEKAFLVGFMMGHITGYVSEVAATLFAAGLITAGIGTVVLGATKLSKAGKVARAVSVIRRLSVLPYREASAIEKVAKILLDWFKLVGNVDEAKLAKFLDEAVLLGKEQELLRLVEHYGLDVETIVGDTRHVPRLEKLAAALSGTEETAEVAVRLGQLASKKVLVGGELKPFIFTEEGLERAAKGLDNLILAAKRGQVDPAFVDRILSALDNPADVTAALGKLQGGDAFLHEGEMLEAFFRALATQWDGATFAQLERLMNRWASALPPPQAGEGVLDIVSMLAKYGKKAEGGGQDAASATSRIVRELDLFSDSAPARQAQLDELVQGLIRHDKNYTDDLTRVDLDNLTKNLERGRNNGPGNREGLLREEVEAIYWNTQLTNKDGYGGTNITLFRRMESPNAANDEQLVNILKSTLMDMDEWSDAAVQGLPVYQLRTQNGRFIDVVVPRTTSSRTITVFELDGEEVVTRPHEILAGTFLAKEDKSYVLATWDAEKIAAAHRQVAEGFEEAVARGGAGESLLVITEDILDTETGAAKLKQLLQKIQEPLGNYPGTGRVVIRPRRSVQKEVATGFSYNERIRDLLRSLVQ